MPNVILTSSGYVDAPDPDPPSEGAAVMAEESPFPRWYFSSHEPGGRVFETQDEFDAAGGQAVWKRTPTEAADATAASAPEGEPTPPRTRR